MGDSAAATVVQRLLALANVANACGLRHLGKMPVHIIDLENVWFKGKSLLATPTLYHRSQRLRTLLRICTLRDSLAHHFFASRPVLLNPEVADVTRRCGHVSLSCKSQK